MARNKGVQKKLYKNLEKKKARKSQKVDYAEPRVQEKKSSTPKRPTKYTGIKGAYLKHLNKLLFIPIIILILAVTSIGMHYAETGDFFRKDVSLEGGLTVTINRADLDVASLESVLVQQFGAEELSIRELKKQGVSFGVIIEGSSTIDPEQMKTSLTNQLGELSRDELSMEITGSALGQRFFTQLVKALLLAFLFMGVVVMIYFRALVPAGAVILAAICDLTGTLAVVNLLGMRLSSAGIAAFLMLIGYAVDTNILLSSRLLKSKEGTVEERLFSAMKPGIFMSLTTLAVVGVGMVLSQAETLAQIMTIIFVGLLFDMMNTWIQNAAVLHRYVLKKGDRK